MWIWLHCHGPQGKLMINRYWKRGQTKKKAVGRRHRGAKTSTPCTTWGPQLQWGGGDPRNSSTALKVLCSLYLFATRHQNVPSSVNHKTDFLCKLHHKSFRCWVHCTWDCDFITLFAFRKFCVLWYRTAVDAALLSLLSWLLTLTLEGKAVLRYWHLGEKWGSKDAETVLPAYVSTLATLPSWDISGGTSNKAAGYV